MLLKNVSIITLLVFAIFGSGCGTPKPTDMQLASGVSYTDRHPKANLNKIKELVSAGQNVNEKGWGGETVLRTAINSSVSHKADSFNYLAIADYLLDHGADPNAPSEMSQDSILMMAVSSNNRQLVEKLLAKGANVNYVNVYEQSALSTAASLGNAELVEYLHS
jgi:ankyrin repeat protein